MKKIRAFLDTNVVARVLGQGHSPNLFEPQMLDKVTYVVSPIVLQELLMADSAGGAARAVQEIQRIAEVAPVDVSPSDTSTTDRIRRLRNTAVHSNDVLIMSSTGASECDYLVTWDEQVIDASKDESFRAVTPEEFVQLVGSTT